MRWAQNPKSGPRCQGFHPVASWFERAIPLTSQGPGFDSDSPVSTFSLFHRWHWSALACSSTRRQATPGTPALHSRPLDGHLPLRPTLAPRHVHVCAHPPRPMPPLLRPAPFPASTCTASTLAGIGPSERIAPPPPQPPDAGPGKPPFAQPPTPLHPWHVIILSRCLRRARAARIAPSRGRLNHSRYASAPPTVCRGLALVLLAGVWNRSGGVDEKVFQAQLQEMKPSHARLGTETARLSFHHDTALSTREAPPPPPAPLCRPCAASHWPRPPPPPHPQMLITVRSPSRQPRHLPRHPHMRTPHPSPPPHVPAHSVAGASPAHCGGSLE